MGFMDQTENERETIFLRKQNIISYVLSRIK